MNWKPIAEAPRDGTWVFLWVAEKAFDISNPAYVGRWATPAHLSQEILDKENANWWGDEERYFFETFSHYAECEGPKI